MKIENRKKEPMLCVQIKNIQNLINCMCKLYFLFLKILKQKENKGSCIICFEVMISRNGQNYDNNWAFVESFKVSKFKSKLVIGIIDYGAQ